MNDVKTWADIDASPLLQLPPEQRKKLHDANDERFRTFWAECFLTTQTPGRGEEAWNSADFCDAFLDAFDLWEPKPGQTFSMYLRTAVRHSLLPHLGQYSKSSSVSYPQFPHFFQVL